jgi:hypothetical protein
MQMQTTITALIAITLLAGPCCALARADGGQIRASHHQGNYQITVFTSPTPLRAGPVDVSVLVQDAESGRTLDGATIVVELTSPDRTLPPLRIVATSAAATNQLFRAAMFDLPKSGQWNVRVECTTPRDEAPITVAFSMDAAPPLPPWLTVWPWFTWPAAAVLLFAIHRTLVNKRNIRRSIGGTSSSGGTPGASSDRRGEFVTAPPTNANSTA